MFLQNLRTQTADCHKALEENSYSVALLSNNVSMEDYKIYLQKLYGVVSGFEKNVFPLLERSLPTISERRKAHLLLQDISAENTTDTIAVLPDKDFTTFYTTEAAAWGGMYVLEGSTLGGQVIQKHLVKSLPDFEGSSYFSAYGLQIGSQWKDFLQQLSIAAQTPGWEQEIIDSAIHTFTMIDNWMRTESSTLVQHKNL
ncbi:biliverdin-producing heme oxygenase [Xanthocytophaga flava]|uniref:biliverdin-producing heme oxygenase n=1 Tax=Xanthocytophaga flava TaxID=3048013 RepID=UPI0028D543C7|nr:biliverdin-producing heme oxygenase [Xanthocytophaga flavus]MDJ1468369.1 biliverdin-producing heme oxygenase [Xanthocytophaga flavus]